MVSLDTIPRSETFSQWTQAQKDYVRSLTDSDLKRVQNFEIVAGQLLITFSGFSLLFVVGKRGGLRFA